MIVFRLTIIALIFTQVILQTVAFDIFDYKPVPDLIKVRKREDAKNAEFYALDFIGLVEEQGRKAEEHNVTTADGFKLKIFRVPPNPSTIKKSGRNPVVYLGHGLAATSDCFVIFGPGKSLVYLLSDAGYDVWIGNVRGNAYSRQHERLSPDQADFWDFSLDEFGTIDLPTMLDYTMNYTGQEKITYIGHSLGTTTVLMLLAEKPEFVKKFDLVIHFAPVAAGATRTLMRAVGGIGLQIAKQLLDPRGTTEIFKQGSALMALYTRVCAPNNILDLCYLPFALLLGDDPVQMPIGEFLPYLSYYPAGTSSKSFYHYYQMFESSKFRKYDYGEELNMKHYGQPEPPEYKLSHVDVPSVMFHGQNDPLSTLTDNKLLISTLHPNISLLYQVVPFKGFNHLDFITAKDVKTLLYDRVLQILKYFHKNQADASSNFDENNNGL